MICSPHPQGGSPEPATITLSSARSRALALLHTSFPLHPDVFAHYMWPESKSWSRGHQPGRAIRAKASNFLARLERDGLARRCEIERESRGYVISRQGERAIDSDGETHGDGSPDNSTPTRLGL